MQAVLASGIITDEALASLQKQLDALKTPPQNDSRRDPSGQASVVIENPLAPYLQLLSEWIYSFRSKSFDLALHCSRFHYTSYLLTHVVDWNSARFRWRVTVSWQKNTCHQIFAISPKPVAAFRLDELRIDQRCVWSVVELFIVCKYSSSDIVILIEIQLLLRVVVLILR